MKRKINNRLIQLATLAIFMTLLLTVAVCYQTYKKQVMYDLKSEAGIIKYYVMNRDVNPLAGVEELFEQENVRVTLIDQDGAVIYDTRADADGMENHSARSEVRNALLEGEGSAIRQSETLGVNTYYYAVRLKNSQVLRVAKDADSIYRILDVAVPYLMGIVVLLILVCSIFSHFLSEALMRPIKLIAEDVDNLDRLKPYEELKPYVEAIKSQHNDVVQNAIMRQQFTANVSHELKTPLTAISGYSELIENGMAASEEDIRRFAGEIHGNANRLLTLINDVIRLSELDADGSEEAFEPINLKEIAETCVNMLQINAEKHDVTISFEGENAVIMAARQMVEEVLYNLCDNAIRYNRPGGSVRVTVRDRLDTAVLTVKDTGIGIPKEHQERIFERFYRVDKGRSKATGGTGLGLAIVKHILMKLNAVLKLESEEGVGTEIAITFPAVRGGAFK